ncbi:DUF2892 domain-containing protein [Flavobacterium paronense]|uniref:DUF2892 domain-containing protein n=1 Tax=Flavobacterium paronense TaxID=1392775 RepID=A0ABV5GBK5_9FLAO|nr:DUF2892 domain-containing protein [Flavobacterium paronense]MDN3677652.1 DUF2892 domain-containing protein [Flavobacterium paronense]
MKKNMGTTDKLIRIVLAVIVAILYFTNTISGTVAIVLGALAVVFVLTSLISFCPLYAPFGINTCSNKTK